MSTIARRGVPVEGTILGAALRNSLRALMYSPASIAEVLDHVGTHGTGTGCPSLDVSDVEGVNDLVIRHTGHIESDPNDWPACYDEWLVGLTDELPPPEPEPFMPSDADLEWYAREFFAVEALSHLDLPPVRGGAPDEPEPARGVRSRVVTGWTDADQQRHTGCV